MAIERSKEQRKFGRRAVFKPAAIVCDDGRRIEGTVLDLSEGGAKIRVSDADALSGEFYLEILPDDLIIRSRLVFADNGIVGVKFVKPPRRISWIRK